MYPYQSSQLGTLLALINQSNPGLTVPLTQADLRSLVPTSITPGTGAIQDTSLRLMAVVKDANYYGTQTVKYRRIDFGSFYRNILPLQISPYSAQAVLTPQQVADAINQKYGTALVASDLNILSLTPSTSAQSIPITSTSLCYKGTLTVIYTAGKQDIKSVIADGTKLTGKLYPGGNVFGGGRKPQGEYFAYGLDCSSIDTTLAALPSSVVVTPTMWNTAGNGYSGILQFLQQNLPSFNFSGTDSATSGGLGNLTLTKYTLPSTSVPGANSGKYANVVLITAAAGSWFQGNIMMHFN